MVIARAAVASNAKRVFRGQRIPRTESISLAISDVDELFEEWDEAGALMVGFLEKRAISGEVIWFQRRAMFNKERFCMSKLGSQKTSDYILLRDIELVRKIDMQNSRHGGSTATNRRTSIATAPTSPYPPNPAPKAMKRSTSPRRLSISATTFAEDEEDDQGKAAFEIHTSQDGRNLGTVYCFRAENEVVCQDWVDSLNKAAALAKKRGTSNKDLTTHERCKKWCSRLHDSNVFQFGIAFLILLNFCINVAAAEFLPEKGSTEWRAYETIDQILTFCFGVELAMNMFINWWKPFFTNSWSVFDLVVVTVSLLAVMFPNIPAVNVLRLVRVFRVIRVFQWFRSLRIIINAITAAVVPVLSSFVVLFLMTCIYAMMAWEFFAEQDSKHFGNFSNALFTMFQVCTGDGWANNVVRPLFNSFNDEADAVHGSTALFFVSFVLIVGTVLLNIVVAVLLDEFITSVGQEKAEMAKQKVEKKSSTMDRLQGTLDPVLSTLASFNNAEELNERISKLWQTLNVDDAKEGIGFVELYNGLRRLNVTPAINFSEEDWDIVTEDGQLCNYSNKIDADGFRIMLKRQLKQFVQRHMANAMCEAEMTDPQTSAIFFVLKQLTISLDEIAASLPEQASSAHGESFLGFESWSRVTSSGKLPPPPGRFLGDGPDPKRMTVRQSGLPPPVDEGMEEVGKVVLRLEAMMMKLDLKIDQRVGEVHAAVKDIAQALAPDTRANPQPPPAPDSRDILRTLPPNLFAYAPSPASEDTLQPSRASKPARHRKARRSSSPRNASAALRDANPSVEEARQAGVHTLKRQAPKTGARAAVEAPVTDTSLSPAPQEQDRRQGWTGAQAGTRGDERGSGSRYQAQRAADEQVDVRTVAVPGPVMIVGGDERAFRRSASLRDRERRRARGASSPTVAMSHASHDNHTLAGGLPRARPEAFEEPSRVLQALTRSVAPQRTGHSHSRHSAALQGEEASRAPRTGLPRHRSLSPGRPLLAASPSSPSPTVSAIASSAARGLVVARASAIARQQDGLPPHQRLRAWTPPASPLERRAGRSGAAVMVEGGGGLQQGTWPAEVRAPSDALQ